MTIKAPGRLYLALALGIFASRVPARAQQSGNTKVVKVSIKVDSEGPSGLWTQAGKDLTLTELDQLRFLIARGVGKLENHKLVSLNEKDDTVGFGVVAEKVQCGDTTYILLSSALILSKANGIDELVTHDVIAERSLNLAANAVLGELLSAELRAHLR